jgi:linoleoyl-CoA desaturase
VGTLSSESNSPLTGLSNHKHSQPFTPTTSPTTPKFPSDQGFQVELRRRVDHYFKSTGRQERDCWQMYLKSAIILIWFASSYFLLVFVSANWWQTGLAAIALAFSMAAIGFSIQHDGGHQAYSKYPWINKLASMSLDMIGGSSYLWHWQHVVYHHTYVNVTGQDTDIDLGMVGRLSPHQPRRRYHRYQHLYLWFLYGLMAVRWQLWGDFKALYDGKIGDHKIPRMKGWNYLLFFSGKAIAFSFAFVLPLCYHSIWIVLPVYLFVTFVVGIVMSVVFQLAHCVEEAEFPMPKQEDHRMEQSWAIHQVETTVDFARRSRSLTWLLGGLNFQIEHHLFPRICHIHYPALSQIVEQTCKEFGVRYVTHQSFASGIGSHYRWLRRMGQSEPT